MARPFELHDAVKSTGKILQVGSQGCTAAAWHKAAELIKAGTIGTPVWAQGYYCRNNPKGKAEWNYASPGLVYRDRIWIGTSGNCPFITKPNSTPTLISAGANTIPIAPVLLGDLVPHRLLPLMLATGNPEFPTRVVSLGTKNVHSDEGITGTPERDCPEQVELLAEFPSGLTLVIVASTVAARSPGFVIYGHHASLEIGTSGERVEVKPEKRNSPTTLTCRLSTASRRPRTSERTKRIGLTASAPTSSPTPASIWPSAPRPSFPWRKCPIA